MPFLYHWTPDPADVVNNTDPPAQNETAPDAMITGVAGTPEFKVTATADDAGETPQLLADVAV